MRVLGAVTCLADMPPSPALKCSPGRELRGETHKRGRSFESGLLGKEKDDDLALFNEMQTKEKESFLLQSSDDLEDLFCNFLNWIRLCILGFIFCEPKNISFGSFPLANCTHSAV